jgi:hypothetical protein
VLLPGPFAPRRPRARRARSRRAPRESSPLPRRSFVPRPAQAGIAERMSATATLLVGQRVQDDAGGLGRRDRGLRRNCSGSSCRSRRLAGAGALGGRRSGQRGLDLGLPRDPGLHLLDDDRFGAAMAEALAHDALLDPAPFQGQRLGRADAKLLFASLFRCFSHSYSDPPAFRRVPVRPSGPRKRSRRAKRARNALLSRPESRAACTTFDRPNAKSN